MVDLWQGDIWWADIPVLVGSGPGFRRPVIVVQGDHLNQSMIATVVCVPLTSNIVWAEAPGNMLISAKITGLSKDSVAIASQIITLDRSCLKDRSGKLASQKLADILSGIDIILGR